MTTSRRSFIKVSAVLAAAPMAFGTKRPDQPAQTPSAPVGPEGKAAKPLKLLILGGTAFLGPEVVAAAQARGHTVTLFNRGKTRPGLFPDLEKLHGDRDPKKDEGLKALEGRSWDAVIDNSGYFPRHVKASAELLAPRVGQYVFISSVSAYKDSLTPNRDETAAVGTMEDAAVETMGKDMSNYGPLKALCEQAAEAAMPGRVTNIRPGFIVGPGDTSGRFNYWPVRIEKGGEVLAPGTPDDPVQIIDVRDLAEWMVHCVEEKVMGVYNALGPERPLRWGSVLETCKRVTGSDAALTWVDATFVAKHEKPGDNFPIWLDPHGETAGFHRWSNARATAKGLKFRPVEETVRDLLKWYHGLTPDRQARFVAGVSIEREAELLDLWRLKREG